MTSGARAASRPGAPRRSRRRLIVAIDGPAGSGKTTVATGVARALRLERLDTGAMYRALALKSLEAGIDPSDARRLAALARRTRFDHDRKGLLVDGRRPGRRIRSPEVNRVVSEVSAHPGVRRELVRRQRELVADGGIVAEGRDIGTVVCPDADVKVFLTASIEERAGRRHRQLAEAGIRVGMDRLKKDQIRRDRLDATRKVSPLAPSPDAHVIDSTGRTAADVVREIGRIAKEAERGRRRR